MRADAVGDLHGELVPAREDVAAAGNQVAASPQEFHRQQDHNVGRVPLERMQMFEKIPGVKTTALLALLIVSATFGGCDNVQSSPKRIDADGQSFLACHDFVWVGDEGGGLLGGSQAYKVTFTDAAGLSRTLRGVKKLEVSDLPRTVTARTPLNPTMLDKDGKRPIEGATYTWSDGSQARFHNGQWEPVEVPNDVCKPSR
jgi:hypothetical protein